MWIYDEDGGVEQGRMLLLNGLMLRMAQLEWIRRKVRYYTDFQKKSLNRRPQNINVYWAFVYRIHSVLRSSWIDMWTHFWHTEYMTFQEETHSSKSSKIEAPLSFLIIIHLFHHQSKSHQADYISAYVTRTLQSTWSRTWPNRQHQRWRRLYTTT